MGWAFFLYALNEIQDFGFFFSISDHMEEILPPCKKQQ